MTGERTLDGGIIYQPQQIHGGRPIRLEFQESDPPLLTLTDVHALRDMASVPGQTFILDWDGQSYVVLFDHTQQPCRFEQVIGYYDEVDDLFTGEINLLTAI